jgi:hypothetical protein
LLAASFAASARRSPCSRAIASTRRAAASRNAAVAFALTASINCASTSVLSPGRRRFDGKPHIGERSLTGSTSMCAHHVWGFSRVSLGIHGTSTSTSSPTSASATCLPGIVPPKQGELRAIFKCRGLNSNTRIPESRASSSMRPGARRLRPAYDVIRIGYFAASRRSAIAATASAGAVPAPTGP